MAWTLAVLAVLCALIRVFGLERGWLLDQLVAFTPYLGIAALFATGLVAVLRRWVPTAVAGVAALSLLVGLLPRTFGSPGTSGTPLVVMSSNMRIGGADANALVALVASAHVNILALQEYTWDAENRLQAAGLARLLPYHETHPESGVQGSAIYSSFPLSNGGMRLASGEGHEQAYATVTVDSDTHYLVESVHPVPPIDGYLDSFWAQGLRTQPKGDAPGTPWILAGDFNATLDHAALRAVLSTGYRDAASVAGVGFTPTWPYYGHRVWITPKITLDHVLIPSGVGVRDFRAVTIPGTDHRAIVATLLV